METTKNFLKSKSIWGIVVLLAATLGIGDLIPADLAETAPAFIDTIFAIIGAVLAAYGRFAAKDKLTVVPTKDA
jgi:hypothetical protein